MALVSVVIPCYNQARFLGEALESVLKQSYPHFEVVVVDDGSTDNTSEVASRYPGVRCIRQENRGRSAARNRGLNEARGEYLVFLDADDRLLPGALEVGLRELKAHPECAFVSGYHRLIAFDGTPFPDWRPPLAENDHYEALLRGNYIAMHATVVYRRTVFETVGVFDTSLEACEDYDLYLRITREYPVYHHGEVVAEYRQHGGNTVRNSALMLRFALRVLRAQLKYIRGSKQRTDAYNAGVRFWQQYYGGPLVEEVRGSAEAGERGQAQRRMMVLLRHYLRGFASMLPGPHFAQGKKTRDDTIRTRELEGLQQTASRFGNGTRRRGLILLYHRVTELSTDPWALTVTPKHFDEHLEILRHHVRPIGLQQLSRALLDGDLPDRSVVVTFDDGYADNLHSAKTLLERHDIPATVCITTGYIGHEREVWSDDLDRLLLQPGTLPESLCVNVNGSTYQWELGEAAFYGKDDFQRYRSWKAWEEAPSARHSLYASLWELLHPLAVDERQEIMDELLMWGDVELVARPSHRYLSLEEVCALAHGDLIEVGAHTVTHPSLSALPIASQREEIRQSKARLEEILSRPLTSFAYPYGKRSDYTSETIAMTRKAGFACACSNVAGLVGRSADLFQLPRIHVHDWDGEEFARQLAVWFDD